MFKLYIVEQIQFMTQKNVIIVKQTQQFMKNASHNENIINDENGDHLIVIFGQYQNRKNKTEILSIGRTLYTTIFLHRNFFKIIFVYDKYDYFMVIRRNDFMMNIESIVRTNLTGYFRKVFFLYFIVIN